MVIVGLDYDTLPLKLHFICHYCPLPNTPLPQIHTVDENLCLNMDFSSQNLGIHLSDEGICITCDVSNDFFSEKNIISESS